MPPLPTTSPPSPINPPTSANVALQSSSRLGPSPPPCPPTAICDTGATGHFLSINAPYENKRPAISPLHVALADQSIITSSHQVDLDLPSLPASARIAHLFPALGDTSLLSIGQLCDAGCTAIFNAETVHVYQHHKLLFTGHRSAATNNLWQVNLPFSKPSDHHASTAMQGSPAQLVAFAHAALFSPSISTLAQALHNNYLPGFPGLSPALLAKYPPNSVATAKGHLDQVRKNLRSTKPFPALVAQSPLPSPEEPDRDQFPLAAPPGIHTDHCFAAIMDSTGQIFTDQTGRFILPSSQGNTQLLILYSYDANYIHAEPMKSKSTASILTAYKSAYATLIAAGLKPRLQRLDNEASTALKEFLHESDIDFQLAPPGIHRRNAAERAIR